MSLSKNCPGSMLNLLKKEDKYLDAEEAGMVIKISKNDRRWRFTSESAGDEPRFIDKNKSRNEHVSKGHPGQTS